MDKEKDFFKTCFNIVAGLEVKNESQAIAKEVVLSEIEQLQQENKQLKDNWNKLKEYAKAIISTDNELYGTDLLDKMQELEGKQK